MRLASRFLLGSWLLAGALAPAAGAAPKPAAEPSPVIAHEAESAVVKVFSTMRRPDVARPWSKASPIEAFGSGVVIEGKRIVTNAHVIAYSSQVQVQGNQSGDKISATVAAMDPGIDLAVLKLEDESFFDNRPPLPRASVLPQIKDPVLAYGFPTGGTTLSITRGIVSRIEFVPYGISTSGLRIQIDAAINPGNSGGPAISDNRMIGLAFSHLANSENISYIIPNEEIELFLKGVAGGHYDGKPGMYDDLQTLENPALRGFLKLEPAVRGMIVHRPDDSSPGYPLKQWDVVTHIGTEPIDDEGMVALRNNLRVGFAYLIQHIARDGTVPLTIVRGGKTQQLQMPVPARRPLLIGSLQGEYPSYFILGPIVFERASIESLQLIRARGQMAFGNPLVARFGDRPDPDRQELVILPAPLFPHALSKGYSDPTGCVLKSVNGTPVRSLAHLVALLRDLKDEYLTLDFDNRASEAMVFPRGQLVAATEAILSDNGVRAQGSADMMKIWEQK
ncbi:MAG TPA: trypsin-like peptidase domain-containing protein [Steroidobacteraceae bacterium]|nr:trypsin-like peptidase domain-containing protein [Steroidobacteraceae bacterium]